MSRDEVLSQHRLDQILEQVKWGNPAARDLDAVVAAIRAGSLPHGLSYTAVHILGRAARPGDEKLVAQFLDGRAGAMVAKVALQMLCSSFDAWERYRSEILRFIEWVPWDESDDVRLVAISQTAEHLRHNRDQDAFQAILTVAGNGAELPITRLAAHVALGRALGDDWGALPAPTATAVDKTWEESMRSRALASKRGSQSDG